MRRDAQLAFSLIELLVVIALLAILAPLAVGGLGRLTQDARMAAALNDFHGALELSRSHAIRSGQSTVICKSADGRRCTQSGDWDQGWLAFEDRNRDGNCIDADGDGRCDDDGGRIVLQGEGIQRWRLRLVASGQYPRYRIRFEPSGLAPGHATTFSLCDLTGRHPPRGLVVSMLGRIRPAQEGDNHRCDR